MKNIKSVKQTIFEDSNKEFSLLLIGPGSIRIPPDGWGGVEQVIYRQMHFFRNLENWNVSLLNSSAHVDWIRIWRKKPQFVYCHYDAFALRVRIYRFLFSHQSIIVGISHYGYLAQPEKWYPSVKFYISHLLRFDKIICLSDKVKVVLEDLNPKTNLVVIPNSIETSRYVPREPEYDFVYLGKVEQRKRQYELASMLDEKTDICFIGPIGDQRVDTLPSQKREWFTGAKSQKELDFLLPLFRVLILTSFGEGDAAVLYEAQACGLSIVVCEEALGSQSVNLPWVYLTDFNTEEINETLKKAVMNNSKFRDKIRSYAEANYDSKLWDYLLLKEILATSRKH